MRHSLFFGPDSFVEPSASACIWSSHLLHGMFPDLAECQRDFFLSFWLHWVFRARHKLSQVAVSRVYSPIGECLLGIPRLLTAVDSPVAEHRL